MHAAASEMLEALEMLVRRHNKDGDIRMPSNVRETLDAAIAKARV
jgi:hypothetical protein